MFNALTSDLLFLRALDGSIREKGIQDALLHAHEFTELADASPPGVVSQIRLLEAVVRRVFPVENDIEWRDLWRKKSFPPEPLRDYFDAHRTAFDLFGDRPFLQVASLSTERPAPLSKLAPEHSSGNNATLFDHTEDRDAAPCTPAEALRRLLVAQSFGLGGLLKARGVIFEAPFSHPNATDGPLARGGVVWLTGDTLFETLMLNLVPEPRNDADLPSWEHPIDSNYFAQTWPSVPAGRYTVLSRAIKLIPETDAATGATVVRRMYLTQGVALSKEQIDPMQSYREVEKIGRRVVLLQPGKATWRDLTALLEMSRDRGIRPAALLSTGRLWKSRYIEKKTAYKFRLHVAGLSADKAKVNLWRHDQVSLPPAFLADEAAVDQLKARLGEANDAAAKLGGRIRAVCYHFLSPVKGMMKPDPDNVSALAKQIDTRRTFWARLETHLSTLLETIPQDTDKARQEWEDVLAEAFREAMLAAKAQLGPSARAFCAEVVSDYLYPPPEDAAAEEGDGSSDTP